MNRMTFGERIRELRKAKNLTLRDVANRVKVNFTYISKIETTSSISASTRARN